MARRNSSLEWDTFEGVPTLADIDDILSLIIMEREETKRNGKGKRTRKMGGLLSHEIKVDLFRMEDYVRAILF